MSTTTISSLDYIGRQITIYLGTLTILGGVIGGFLIIIVFLSLQTFQQNSCAFYLTIMSLVNVGQLLTGFLSRVVIIGFGIDWSLSSVAYCKFRLYCFQVCALVSMTCFCLATIDQYFATCSRPQWQLFCNINLAHYLVSICLLIWIVYNVPYLIYYNHVLSTTTGKLSCIITNPIFDQYTAYGNIVILGKILPVCITLIFGCLAYRNVQQLAHRTLPLVRRQLDKQLTVMVLIQVIFGFFTLLPNAITYPLTISPQLTQNPLTSAILQFINTLTICLLNLYSASPFYIYLCVSDRFRRQLAYVLFGIYLDLHRRRQQRKVAINHPQI